MMKEYTLKNKRVKRYLMKLSIKKSSQKLVILHYLIEEQSRSKNHSCFLIEKAFGKIIYNVR